MANPNFVPAMSTDEIYRGTNTNICLTDELDRIDANKAEANHTHNYAPANHTHEPSTIGAALATHSHYYADLSGMPEALEEKADANHTHSEYASSSHTHSEYAPASHSHSDYADVDHTHSGFAAANHEHDEYFSVDGGTIGGETNVNGVFRVKGQQAFYYNDSGSAPSQTVGTNNATGGTVICCGDNATVTMNGALVKTASIVPRTNNAYNLGNSTYRWKGIYSTTAVNVSSDERLKRDIVPVTDDRLVDFINDLQVVSYNYKSDPEFADPRIGLIAQAVRAIDPELAKFFVKEDDAGVLGINVADLVFPLILAVQKLTTKVEELSNR